MDNFEENYLYHYQRLLFQGDVEDPFQQGIIRRKCISQSFITSSTLSSNEATCVLLENQLNEYAKIIDDQNQNGVNNYAKSVSALTAHCKNESMQWTSELKDAKEIFSKLCKPFTCSDTTKCQADRITQENLRSIKNVLNDSTLDDLATSDNSFGAQKNQFHIGQEKHNRSEFGFGKEPNNFIDQQNLPKKTFSNFSHNTLLSTDAQKNKFCIGPEKNKRSEFEFTKERNNFIEQQNIPEDIFSNFSHNTLVNKGAHSTSDKNIIFQGRQQVDMQKFVVRTPKLASQMHPKQNGSGNQSNFSSFRTARDELTLQNQKKWGTNNTNIQSFGYGAQKRSLGARRGVMNKFIPPIKPDEGMLEQKPKNEWESGGESVVEDERLKNIDPKMIELIRNEIMDNGAPIDWDDIAGLEFAKSTIQEIVVWPMLRPDIFTGLRCPPKGILLFGPPGTGKTLIGKCIASQSRSTFFSISASSLTSKWIGDGEKMVRALFAVARCHQPSVVFIDEIDSLLSQRSETEHESSRRIKTEFLVQLDGAATGEEDRILVIGATNRPQELDEAARRRLVKRLYIPLPELKARKQIVERLMSSEKHCLSENQILEISDLTHGYSGADMKNLCQEASLGPIRSMSFVNIQNITPDEVRPVSLEDFKNALKRVRASVSQGDLVHYVEWDKQYGCGGC